MEGLKATTLLLAYLAFTSPIEGWEHGAGTSLAFFVNDPNDYDYGQQLDIPGAFGTAEFTLELWIRPDSSFPIGSTRCCEGQRLNWSDADIKPYSNGSWWFEGNFLLDGHNNADFNAGTFSLQFYGGGRVRWLFGDGAAPSGGNWSVGAYPADTSPTLLDGEWHQLTLIRRWSGSNDSQLELWVDGALTGSETSPVRPDMQADYWSDWSSFPADQEGWFWGAEKQAAIGILSQYEDYKGPIDELRFWDRAKSAAEIEADWQQSVEGSEPGLVGWFAFDEGAGIVACDTLAPGRCIDLFEMKPGHWSLDEPPLGTELFNDDFESGNTSAWSLTVP